MEFELLLFLVGLLSRGNTEALNCNGRSEYCDLRFNQITLPGSHAAGSGYNGSVRKCQGGSSSQVDCSFRNQNLSITEQLSLGIRFLSLDICILPVACNIPDFGDLSTSRLVSCQGSSSDSARNGYRYGGPITDIFQQIDDWLRINTNEIIGLYFTNTIPEQDLPLAGQMIADILEQKWGEGAAATKMSTFFTSNGKTWPTLSHAIEDRERIFVLFDQELVQGDLTSKPWLHPPPYATMAPSTWNDLCSNLRRAENCNNTNKSDIIILSAFSLSLCLHFAQTTCNSIIVNASNTCFNFLKSDGKVLNVVLVDFVQFNMRTPESVFEIALELNRRNVREFILVNDSSTNTHGMPSLGSDMTTHEANMTIRRTSSAAAATIICNHKWVWFLAFAALCVVFHSHFSTVVQSLLAL